MNEFENKGIEKFFRSKLKPTNQNTDWASPPDFIFEKAIDQVNKEEKEKKRTLTFWISLFGFIIVLSTIIITQSKQLNDVQKSLDKLEEELITSQLNKQVRNENINDNVNNNDNNNDNDNDTGNGNNNGKFNNKVNENQESVNGSISNSKTTSNSNTSIIENRFSKNTKTTSDNNLPSKQKTAFSILNTEKTISTQSNQSFPFQKNELIADQNSNGGNSSSLLSSPKNSSSRQNNTGLTKESSNSKPLIASTQRNVFQFNRVNPIKRSLFDIEYSSLVAYPQFAVINKDIDPQHRFSFAVTSGFNAATFVMDNMDNLDGKTLSDYNKYYSGLQTEVSLLYKVSERFSAGVHANYFKINNRSMFDESSSLDFANMIVVNGKMEYSMPMEIITPIGSHKMKSNLIFDENLNTSNLIRNQSDISQSFNSLGIGVSARYFVLQKSKFSSYVGASFSHHVINKMNSEFNTTISMEEKVMKEFKTIPSEMNNNQKSYKSISAEIGLQYAISPRVNLLMQSSFGKSTNSLLQSNIQTDPKTFLQYIDTGIGISYSL